MIGDRFGALLEELSAVTKIKLPITAKTGCKIRYPDKLCLTIEQDPTGESIFLIADIGTPGEGRFKESILKEALRANGRQKSQGGIFCYSPKAEKLLLFDQLPLEDLNGQRLSEIMITMSEVARHWRDSIARGELPSNTMAGTTKESFMGLR
jgi:hypothetical protein